MKRMTSMFLLVAAMLVSGCDKGDDNKEKENSPSAFELIFGGRVLDNNAKIVADKYISEAGLISCDIEFRNKTKQESAVKVEKEILSTAPANVADINYFCWEKCLTVNVNSITASVAPYVAGGTPMLFTGDIETGTLPTDAKTEINIRYTFTDQTNNLVQKVEITYAYPKQ